MELYDIATMLGELDIPIAYSHFIRGQSPPFLIYKRVSATSFVADNKNYARNDKINIELYTENKDLELEERLEAILCENEVAFDIFESYIESENLYQVIYEITI